jgi:hypothetical protein
MYRSLDNTHKVFRVFARLLLLVAVGLFISCSSGGNSGEDRTLEGNLASGNAALRGGKYDEAVQHFENAFQANPDDPRAIIYSTMAQIARISVDPKVINLFKSRFGFVDYPNRLNALFSTDWMREYQHNTSLPFLGVPAWLPGNNSWFNETLGTGNMHTVNTWTLLLAANLIDKNVYGFNDVLDELIDAVFGSGGSFETARTRIARLENRQDERITLSRDFIQALHLDEFTPITEHDLIGWAEINAIVSVMLGVKASLQWVAAYDWNTNLSVFRHSWQSNEDYFFGRIEQMQRNDLPFINNFLEARPGKMAAARSTFVQAIKSAQASYTAILSSPLYPTVVKDAHRTINEGVNILVARIEGGGSFYVPEDPTTGRWPTSAGSRGDILFGVNMGNFFTEGYFRLPNLFETESNRGPAFFCENSGQRLTSQNYLSVIANAENRGNYIGFRFKSQAIRDIVIYPYLEIDDYEILPMFPPRLARILFEKYHN